MQKLPSILAINGSATSNSSNLAILKSLSTWAGDELKITIIEDLSVYPLFRTELTDNDTPASIIELREEIYKADGIIISSPEYVFSIPAGLKNIIEWCVSTTVFSDKPVGLITASASGVKAHEELQMIMKTIQALVSEANSLLISGVKGKINRDGAITDSETEQSLKIFLNNFIELMAERV